MSDRFLPFHTFLDEDIALNFAEKMTGSGIEYRLEKSPPLLASSIMGESSAPSIVIKLLPGDFEKANHWLDEHYRGLAENTEKEYYLFSFSDKELKEVVTKPDEWSRFDFVLAQKILADRGHAIPDSAIQELKKERKKELSRPEKGGEGILAFAYVLIVGGAFSFLAILRGLENYFPAGVLISVFIGFHLSGDKRVLPDGQLVYAYKETVRFHGKCVAVAGLVIFISSILVLLLLSAGS